MHRKPVRRLLAWLVDLATITVWVAITAAIGVPLFLATGVRTADPIVANLIGAAVMVIPVTLALSWLDSGSRRGSVGKRTLRISVVDRTTGLRVPFRRALLRTTLKVAVPWLIGHAAVYAIVFSSAVGQLPPSVWALTAVAYVMPIVYVVFLFVGSGRTPYDRIARTEVRDRREKPERRRIGESGQADHQVRS
ncbi:MAG: putative integral rane protein [Microbacteriaceae bacterium]|jgi:hypothetical protein|nr:putative integral rane protein [Microbacteriaceae bacterium]